MAELRLSLALLVGLAACRASEAGPTSGLVAPAGWRALPAIANAASDAAKVAKLRVDGAEAWGEPSRGCYAMWIAVVGSHGAPDALADQILASLTTTKELAGLTTGDVVKPAKAATAGVLSLSFAQGPYKGRMRAEIANDGAIGAFTCFWNQREPIACEAACTGWLGALK